MAIYNSNITLSAWTGTIVSNNGIADMTYETTYLNQFIEGRNKAMVGYWECSGTWEDLGVPSGYIVESCNLNVEYACSTFNVGDYFDIGPTELYDSSSNLIGTIRSAYQGTSTESYTVLTGTSVSVGIYSGSTSSIKLRINIDNDSGNNASARVETQIRNLYVSIVASGVASYIKWWSGTQWVSKPIKIWNGSEWVGATVKRYTGSDWVLI